MRLRKAEWAFENKLDDLVVETYDCYNRSPSDVYDKKTRLKVRGFHDYEKVE